VYIYWGIIAPEWCANTEHPQVGPSTVSIEFINILVHSHLHTALFSYTREIPKENRIGTDAKRRSR